MSLEGKEKNLLSLQMWLLKCQEDMIGVGFVLSPVKDEWLLL